jgi:hypothetical protein
MEITFREAGSSERQTAALRKARTPCRLGRGFAKRRSERELQLYVRENLIRVGDDTN